MPTDKENVNLWKISTFLVFDLKSIAADGIVEFYVNLVNSDAHLFRLKR